MPEEIISLTTSASPSVTSSCSSTSGWKLTDLLLSPTPKSSRLLLRLDKSTMEGFLGRIFNNSIGVSLSLEQPELLPLVQARQRPQGPALFPLLFSVRCIFSSLALPAEDGL
uniref:Uncharacterized protein n=1 Tax=Amphimedon queenslandica TaxID=400682 RepID=A0A1X7TS17_AMPQE